MKRKLTVVFISTALTVLMATAAFAATYSSPADIVADLSGKTTEQVLQERGEVKTFGQVAEENLVLDEFRSKMADYKQAVIEQRVQEGTLTEEKAAQIKEAMAERLANCSGSPDGERAKMAQRFGGGLGFGEGERNGNGNGNRDGNGYGEGKGHSHGNGKGMGRTVNR